MTAVMAYARDMSEAAPPPPVARWPAAIAGVGALLGLVFAAYSSIDYIAHLDRQIHDLHCSIIPGAPVDQALESGCRAALYSPYSALLKDRIWGGVPISLFGAGAFAFFVAFSVYVLVGGIGRVARGATGFLAAASVMPLVASIIMAVISATQLGTFCTTCVGMYIASAVLALGGIAAWRVDRRLRTTAQPPEEEKKVPYPGGLVATWLLGMGLFVLAPGLLYLESVPSYRDRVTGCGELEELDEPSEALISLPSRGGKQDATLVVDPLCPTCKAFHERLHNDGVLAQLDLTLVLFPLDSACNWNLQTPLHPGACVVSRAVICGEDDALDVLEWAYENQEELLSAAKSKDGEERVEKLIRRRFKKLDDCMKDKKSRLRLDEHLRYAVDQKLPLTTPQLFLDNKRLCEEDIDIGLPYALSHLAPEITR